MKVFKFGGASVKDAAGVRNLTDILHRYSEEQLMIIVSAIGKTTNKLEVLAEAAYNNMPFDKGFREIQKDHNLICATLFEDDGHPVLKAIEEIIESLKNILDTSPRGSFDHFYDQIICTGELLSTTIVSAYLTSKDISNSWVDVRNILITDDVHREANILWDETTSKVHEALVKKYFQETD